MISNLLKTKEPLSIRSLKFIILAFLLLVSGGCSLKKNTAFTRHYRAFTTRYNVYFNGHEAYKEALLSFEKEYEDNYAELLFIHPVSSLGEGSEGAAHPLFDRAIEKSQKAIRQRSISRRPVKNPAKANDPAYREYLNRKEYNPFLHNAWLLMAKSQFYKGEFMNSHATFLYITRHFSWLPEVVAESRLWMVRCYTELGWSHEAEEMINRIDSSKLPPVLAPLYHQAYAGVLLRQGETARAIPLLKQAIKGEPHKAQRIRMKYLLAQLQEKNGDLQGAYNSFGAVRNPQTDYKTLFNATLSQLRVFGLSKAGKSDKKLRRMLADPRNKEYLDQIHATIGALYLQHGDTVRAITALKQAIAASTRNGMEKASAALRLGDVTFLRGDYLEAQHAYATALGILNEKHADYKRVSGLSGVLDNLAVYAQTVALQDSLLHLALLPEESRMKIIREKIEEVIREEKKIAEQQLREAHRQENSSEFTNPQNILSSIPTSSIVPSGDITWYFYNKQSVSAGKTEFQRKWGVRRPEDNWRRRVKNNSDGETAATPEEPSERESSPESGIKEPTGMSFPERSTLAEKDNKNPAYYLSQLPLTPEARQQAHELIQEALYNMALIFNRQLEDLPLSIATFEKLNTRYPDNSFRLESYYEIYLSYMRMDKTELAERYKGFIIAEFPESAYAHALSNPDYLNNLRTMNQRQESMYQETYQAYLNGETETVHRNYSFVKENWPLSALLPRFLLLDALSYVTTNDRDAVRKQLEQLTALYNDGNYIPMAQGILRELATGRTLASDGKTVRSMIWEQHLSGTKTAESGTSEAVEPFVIEPDTPHLLVLAFQTDSVGTNELLFEVANYNFTNFLIRDFDLEVMTFKDLSLLIIKGFNNFKELSDYRLRMALPGGLLLSEFITPVMISDINFRKLLQGGTFADYFSFMEQQAVAKVEAENPENEIE